MFSPNPHPYSGLSHRRAACHAIQPTDRRPGLRSKLVILCQSPSRVPILTFSKFLARLKMCRGPVKFRLLAVPGQYASTPAKHEYAEILEMHWLLSFRLNEEYHFVCLHPNSPHAHHPLHLNAFPMFPISASHVFCFLKLLYSYLLANIVASRSLITAGVVHEAERTITVSALPKDNT